METVILAIGVAVFASHFLALLFRRTGVPDVLILLLAGLVIGPLLGWVAPDDLGRVGPVIATIALVVILFESGTSLQPGALRNAMGTMLLLSIGGFLLTGAVVATAGVYLLSLPVLPALMLGVILAGTSSAVVIPLVETLQMAEKPGTVLVLESTLTDVLCIVGLVALLQAYGQGGTLQPVPLAFGVITALLFAALIGVIAGVAWLLILGRVRGFPSALSTTLAWAFLAYGASELLGFSGPIAAMALGITLTSFDSGWFGRFESLQRRVHALSEADLAFYREAVFLLKTYFFIYLGISIQFGGTDLLFLAGLMMAAILALRLVLTRLLYRKPNYSLRDTALTSMLAPKGLAAAVLAGLPLQQGVEGGELIRDVTYMVVLVSIILCAGLVMCWRLRSLRAVYAGLLGKPDALPTSSADVKPLDGPAAAAKPVADAGEVAEKEGFEPSVRG